MIEIIPYGTTSENQNLQDRLKTLQNRKVCDVTEASTNGIFGPIKIWKGSLEEEYFSAIFTSGMLTISVSEREMTLGQEVLPVGLVPELKAAYSASEVNMKKGIKLTDDYLEGKGVLDIKEITFGDVIKVLHWEMKDDAKMYEDNLLG